jgi:ubiquitin-conjugating enzyme E2 variant
MGADGSAHGVGYSRFHRVAEALGIAMLLGSIAYGAWQVSAYTTDLVRGLLVAGGVFVGYLLADLCSGIVHWMGDRYGTPETPLVGPNFIRPFREHHVDPKGMTRHDFIETNGNNSLVTLPVIGFCFLVFPLEERWGLFGFCTIVSLAAWVFATNQFHKWSHEDDVPAFVAWLQRNHVILGVRHHDVHHTYPYETYYCITSGWLNEPLHRIRFWSRAEATVEKIFGVSAYRDDSDPGAT